MKLGLVGAMLCFGLLAPAAQAAGWEKVEVLTVENRFTVTCPPDNRSCAMGPRYNTTFKKKDGTTGSILLRSRTTAKYITINFCAPKKQGLMEEPCPEKP